MMTSRENDLYLPRINRRLSIFTAGHNNGPISSERNFTPLQLWVRGLLHLQQPHRRAAGDVNQRVRFVLGKPVLNNHPLSSDCRIWSIHTSTDKLNFF